MSQDVPTLSPSDTLTQAKELFRESTQRGLPVLSSGKLTGIRTRADMLRDPRKRLVLVDHNELEHAIEGAETAEIVEIIDHHRLSAPRTKMPIDVYVRPTGSTCTLVYELFRQRRVDIPPDIAQLLISGVICDTLALRSPTTSLADKTAVEELSQICSIDWHAFAAEIMNSTDPLAVRSPSDIIDADFKIYNEFGVSFGIGQVETVDLDEVPELALKFNAALNAACKIRSIAWCMLLITDIVHCESILICAGLPEAEAELNYARNHNGSFSLPGVLSRKKQLLPEILRILESRQSARKNRES
jgi:manganese-dependent inorganic pyrophosphatase